MYVLERGVPGICSALSYDLYMYVYIYIYIYMHVLEEGVSFISPAVSYNLTKCQSSCRERETLHHTATPCNTLQLTLQHAHMNRPNVSDTCMRCHVMFVVLHLLLSSYPAKSSFSLLFLQRHSSAFECQRYMHACIDIYTPVSMHVAVAVAVDVDVSVSASVSMPVSVSKSISISVSVSVSISMFVSVIHTCGGVRDVCCIGLPSLFLSCKVTFVPSFASTSLVFL